MSDKDRRKKDGQDKNKKNQARNKAEARPDVKGEKAARNVKADDRSRRAEAPAPSSPSAARAYASRAGKGK